MKTVDGVKKRIWIISAVIVLILTIFVAYMMYQSNNKKIYSKVFVGPIDVSNLTKQQAVDKVKSSKTNIDNASLKLKYNEKEWQIPYADLNAGYNIPNSVDKAYMVGRSGNIFSRTLDIIKAKSGVKFDIVFDYDKTYLVETLKTIRNEIDAPKKNAKIMPSSGDGLVVPHTKGVVLDLDQTFSLADEHITKNDTSPLQVVVKEDVPTVLDSQLKDMTKEISSCQTTFNQSAATRVSNIKLACSRIDGIIIQPNEVFSIDKTIKERTTSNGYKMAKAYLENQVVDEVGGGVCQVTTTLYDAVLLANLQVIERKSHSMMVDYVEPGFDAAVSDKGVDLKFKNSMGFPIYLYSSVEGDKITMKIFGKNKDLTKTIKLEPQVTEIYYPNSDEIVYDSSIAKGNTKVEVESRSGYKAYLYKNIYQNGNLVLRELISENIYKPRRGKIRVGI